MRTNVANFSKRFLMALGVVAFGLVAQSAMAGDRSDAYSQFRSDSDLMSLLDTVNRDNGPSRSTGASPYATFGTSDSDTMSLIDAVNRNGGVAQSHSGVSPYATFGTSDSDTMALIDTINRDRAVAHAPSYRYQAPSHGVVVQSFPAQEAVTTDFAQTAASGFNG